MDLIKAKLKDDAFLNDVQTCPPDGSKFHLWWLGQSGFLLKWKDQHVLVDPYLSDSLTKKYANSDKPHVRMSERVIDPVRLNFIDIVTSSHNHTDHLDAETLVPIFQENPNLKFIIPEANRTFVCERLNIPIGLPIGLNAGKKISAREFIFHGIPSAHNELEKDENGNHKYMGYVIEFGNWKIYHSGDTLWFEGMVDILKPFAVDIALLPINGNDPSRKVAGNLNTREAAQLAKAIQAKLVIPCHYNMFTFNTADVKEFDEEAKKIGQLYKVLEIGEKL